MALPWLFAWLPGTLEEMTVEQLAWTLLALLAASTFGNMYYLGSKIDSKFDHLSARIDGVVMQVAELRGEMGELQGEMAMLRGEMAALRGEMAELRGEMAMLRNSFETHVHDPHAHN
jgi:predicted nuclease with TOPRIM domain